MSKLKILFNETDYYEGNGSTLYDNSTNEHDLNYSASGGFVGSDQWSSDTPYTVTSGSGPSPLNLTDSNNIGYLAGPFSFEFTDNAYFQKQLSTHWSGSFTFSVWFKPTESMNNWDGIFSTSNSPDYSNTWQLDSDGNGNIRILIKGTGSFDVNPYTINVWQHVTVTFNYSENFVDRELKVYYNGTLKNTYTSNTDTSLRNTTNFKFENYKIASNRNTDRFFTGFITGVRLYDYALTSDQISNLYLYNSLNGVTIGDPHITTLSGQHYKFSHLGPFRMFDNNSTNIKNRIVINGWSKIGERRRWKNKQYIRIVYFFCGGKEILINTGFRGIEAKVLENKGIDYIEKKLTFSQDADVHCFKCAATFNINDENEIYKHHNKKRHFLLKPVRNMIQFKLETEFNKYLVKIVNINELNYQPCRINVFPIIQNNSKITGCIVDKKYSINCGLENIKDLIPLNYQKECHNKNI